MTPEPLHLIKKGLSLSIGPFQVRITSAIEPVAKEILLLYADYPMSGNQAFNDFHIRISIPAGLRRWFRPQAIFSFDELSPFKPLPLAHAYPFFEWGLNWCIARYSNQFLIIHAGVLEKNGFCAIMPSPPGSGKSTLCAALVNRGWRLLSDELALISPESGQVIPVPRPISLKNKSIEIIKENFPEAVLGNSFYETAKGTVAHMKPPLHSVERAGKHAKPAWVLFPKYRPGSPMSLSGRSKAKTLMKLIKNSFNHNALGRVGFEAAAGVIDRCDCFDFEYSDLEEAIAAFNNLEPPSSLFYHTGQQRLGK